ncbi:uncharacterized protein UDID_18620 [Ustilago sp. UG-2017a]|nr:uncharacterized protein UDID_18620 [Ustilago sp. UG-2017a]
MDKENKTREITLPQIDYGDDKEAQALTRQEDARIEEVEMPADDQSSPALRIAEIDEAAVKEIEPPLMTPRTKEQMDHAIHAAVLKHIADGSDRLDDWQRILRENQRISQNTTMNVLKTKIHGIPQSVSSGKPLWLDQEDEETQRTKAQLFDQLTERKKRLNGKVESLKKRYRSINEEWKSGERRHARPDMRAARTTATAPDMFIDPDSDHLMKLRYDDVNGYVADPLAFYLDEFDPDLWSEEEKAIFARRYALWPKQFGKIAQALPHKTPAQCGEEAEDSVKPKKAKGSALMADLKSAKGEEMDDVEDGSGVRSPMDSTDPSLADAPTTTNGRGRGGRARMVPPVSDGIAEEQTAGRKRTADQTDAEGNSTDAKAEKRKSGPKSKRAKSDSASATDKARKPRASLKKDSAAVDDGKTAGVPPVPAVPGSGPKLEASDAHVRGPAAGDVQPSAGSDAANIGDLSGDGRKAGKKRRSKTAAPGEEGADGSGKGRGKQPTSSYWSVAERCEFLRALVVHGPRWEVVSSTLAQKSAAQARNYFARNEDEIDFAEAAALSRSHADLPLAEREAAALAFVRNRFASNSTGTGVLPASSSGGALPSMMREESPEPQIQRRGLQINSLLNDNNDAASSRMKRRSSLHELQGEKEDAQHMGLGRMRLYHQHSVLDKCSISTEVHSLQDDSRQVGLSARTVDPCATTAMSEPGCTRGWRRSTGSVEDVRQMRDEGQVDSRSWMYDSPYEAHRRPSPQPGYASMAPPSHPAERAASDSPQPMSASAQHTGMADMPPWSREHLSKPFRSCPFCSRIEKQTHKRPLTAPLPSTTDRPAYEQRCQRYSQSPGPSTTPTSAGVGPGAGGFSAASAYRSSNNPYSSFPSQSLPRPSLPVALG